MIINRIRLDGLIYSLKSPLQLNMCQELQIFVFVCTYSGASQVFLRLCDSDFGITPVDDITVYQCHFSCILLPHSTYFIHQFLVFVLFVGYCFGEITCIRDGYVYQNAVLCFLIHEGYVRSVKQYCFVRNYSAVPVQLEIVIPQYTGWCVLTVWTLVFNQVSCFCQFLMDNFG